MNKVVESVVELVEGETKNGCEKKGHRKSWKEMHKKDE
jgi:hypothetical protein